MSRSVDSWFAERERSSMDDKLDDEVVERADPWDARAAVKRSTAQCGPRAGSASVGMADARGSSKKSGRSMPVPGAPARKKLEAIPPSTRARIVARLRVQPDAAPKVVAAFLRQAGVNVTRAQVLEVKQGLAALRKQRNPVKGFKGLKAKGLSKPAASVPRPEFRVSGGSAKPAPSTPLCSSCGARIGVLTASCACS